MFRLLTDRITFSPDDPVAPPPVAPPVTPPVEPPAHSVTAPWGAGTEVWKLGEGDAAKPWYEAIPEEPVRESMKSKDYKNPAEVAMAYHNLMKVQRNGVVIPGDDAPPEQINEFYTKLGRPEAKDKYELQMPQGVEADPRMVDFAKDVSFELGLNPKQAQKLADKWNEFAPALNAEAVEAERVANEQAISALETEWGGAGQLEANKAAGRRVVDALGLDAATVDAIDKAMGTAPLVKLLAMIGRKSDEGGLVTAPGGGDPNDPANMTKEQAQAKIASLQSDEAFQKKYTDKNHPEHTDALRYMEKLFARG